jgi:hypothetical protein
MKSEAIKIHVAKALACCLGQQTFSRLYLRACISRYRKAGVVFIHIPRAAGSSVAAAVLGRRAGHFSVREVRREMGYVEFDSHFSFSVTRNPYGRLVSAFLYARQGGGSHGGVMPNEAYRSSAFSSFSRFVREWLVHQNICTLDYVFRPQWMFLEHEGRLGVDYVGKVEDLAEVEKTLSHKLGRPVCIGRINQTSRSGLDLYYDDGLREIVAMLYAKDFSLLDYNV